MRRDALSAWWHELSYWQRFALSVWTAILLVLCVRNFVTPYRNTTFPTFATAARRWVSGGSLYAYAPGEQYDKYRYSPAATVLLVPLGVLPDRLGGILWRFVLFGTFFGALAWWCREALPITLTPSQRGLIFVLVTPLALGSLANAQTNALVIGWLLIAIVATVKERWTLASVCLALATVIKIYPLSFAMILCLIWPKRFIPRLALLLPAVFAIPFLFQPAGYVVEQYRAWFMYLQADDRHFWELKDSYRDGWLLCRLWGVPISTDVYLGVQLTAAAGVAALSWVAAVRRPPVKELLAWVFALTSCWIMVFGPSTESCTYIMLAPTMAWTLLRCRLQRAGFVPTVVSLLSFILFVVTGIASWFPFGPYVHALGLQPIGAVLLTGVVLWLGVEAVPAATPSATQTAAPRQAA